MAQEQVWKNLFLLQEHCATCTYTSPRNYGRNCAAIERRHKKHETASRNCDYYQRRNTVDQLVFLLKSPESQHFICKFIRDIFLFVGR